SIIVSDVCYIHVFFFFFFQAEDGIRDGHVTGVQTCALTISTAQRTTADLFNAALRYQSSGRVAEAELLYGQVLAIEPSDARSLRSEERRVGKECRARWGR